LQLYLHSPFLGSYSERALRTAVRTVFVKAIHCTFVLPRNRSRELACHLKICGIGNEA